MSNSTDSTRTSEGVLREALLKLEEIARSANSNPTWHWRTLMADEVLSIATAALSSEGDKREAQKIDWDLITGRIVDHAIKWKNQGRSLSEQKIRQIIEEGLAHQFVPNIDTQEKKDL